MNKIYKVVWSKVKNCYVVVSEISKNIITGGVKSAKIGTAPMVKGAALGALMAFMITGSAMAAGTYVDFDKTIDYNNDKRTGSYRGKETGYVLTAENVDRAYFELVQEFLGKLDGNSGDYDHDGDIDSDDIVYFRDVVTPTIDTDKNGQISLGEFTPYLEEVAANVKAEAEKEAAKLAYEAKVTAAKAYLEITEDDYESAKANTLLADLNDTDKAELLQKHYKYDFAIDNVNVQNYEDAVAVLFNGELGGHDTDYTDKAKALAAKYPTDVVNAYFADATHRAADLAGAEAALSGIGINIADYVAKFGEYYAYEVADRDIKAIKAEEGKGYDDVKGYLDNSELVLTPQEKGKLMVEAGYKQEVVDAYLASENGKTVGLEAAETALKGMGITDLTDYADELEAVYAYEVAARQIAGESYENAQTILASKGDALTAQEKGKLMAGAGYKQEVVDAYLASANGKTVGLEAAETALKGMGITDLTDYADELEAVYAYEVAERQITGESYENAQTILASKGDALSAAEKGQLMVKAGYEAKVVEAYFGDLNTNKAADAEAAKTVLAGLGVKVQNYNDVIYGYYDALNPYAAAKRDIEGLRYSKALEYFANTSLVLTDADKGKLLVEAGHSDKVVEDYFKSDRVAADLAGAEATLGSIGVDVSAYASDFEKAYPYEMAARQIVNQNYETAKEILDGKKLTATEKGQLMVAAGHGASVVDAYLNSDKKAKKLADAEAALAGLGVTISEYSTVIDNVYPYEAAQRDLANKSYVDARDYLANKDNLTAKQKGALLVEAGYADKVVDAYFSDANTNKAADENAAKEVLSGLGVKVEDYNDVIADYYKPVDTPSQGGSTQVSENIIKLANTVKDWIGDASTREEAEKLIDKYDVLNILGNNRDAVLDYIYGSSTPDTPVNPNPDTPVDPNPDTPTQDGDTQVSQTIKDLAAMVNGWIGENSTREEAEALIAEYDKLNLVGDKLDAVLDYIYGTGSGSGSTDSGTTTDPSNPGTGSGSTDNNVNLDNILGSITDLLQGVNKDQATGVLKDALGSILSDEQISGLVDKLYGEDGVLGDLTGGLGDVAGGITDLATSVNGLTTEVGKLVEFAEEVKEKAIEYEAKLKANIEYTEAKVNEVVGKVEANIAYTEEKVNDVATKVQANIEFTEAKVGELATNIAKNIEYTETKVNDIAAKVEANIKYTDDKVTKLANDIAANVDYTEGKVNELASAIVANKDYTEGKVNELASAIVANKDYTEGKVNELTSAIVANKDYTEGKVNELASAIVANKDYTEGKVNELASDIVANKNYTEGKVNELTSAIKTTRKIKMLARC